MKGTITGIKHERGFGFIEGDDGEEYFMHVDDRAGGVGWLSVQRGQRIEFDVAGNGKKGNGLRATEWRVV